MFPYDSLLQSPFNIDDDPPRTTVSSSTSSTFFVCIDCRPDNELHHQQSDYFLIVLVSFENETTTQVKDEYSRSARIFSLLSLLSEFFRTPLTQLLVMQFLAQDLIYESCSVILHLLCNTLSCLPQASRITAQTVTVFPYEVLVTYKIEDSPFKSCSCLICDLMWRSGNTHWWQNLVWVLCEKRFWSRSSVNGLLFWLSCFVSEVASEVAADLAIWCGNL